MADATAGLAPDELFVGSTGAIWLADVGSTFPADHTAQPSDAEWLGLGYTSEDGPKFTFDKTVKKIMGWQSQYGLRTIVTERPSQVEFELLQWTAEGLKLAMGGGTITAAGSGAQYTPPSANEIDEKALIIEGRDGSNIVRVCFEKVSVVDKVEFGFQREEETRFPLTLDVLESDDPDNDPAWFIQTNLADIVDGITT